MQRAHEVHYLRHKVSFTNPFMEGELGDYIGSLIVVIWRPGPIPSEAPRWQASEAQPKKQESLQSEQALHVRRCVACGKWRLLPRHQPDVWSAAGEQSPAAETPAFRCASILDDRRNTCEGPQPVCTW